MVRAMQYRPLFERSQSWRAEYTSLHSELLARILQDSHRLRWRILTDSFRVPLEAYSAHWDKRQEDAIVERAAEFDVVCIVKSPSLPLCRRLRRLSRPRVLMDINDGLWLPAFRNGEWRDLDAMLSEVNGVICENEYIARYVRKFNQNVFIVPDAPQVEVFDKFRGKVPTNPQQLTIGWLGGSENVGPLYRILEPLEALFARYAQLHLRILGAGESTIPRFEKVRWSCRAKFDQEEMVREVLAFDIGLFPLFHNEDGCARGTLKAMIYMSGEAVAVCEDYGENPKLIQDGFNGVLASSPEAWYEKLEWLITHPEQRSVIGRRGLETIRERFTAERVFPKLVAAYERILG